MKTGNLNANKTCRHIHDRELPNVQKKILQRNEKYGNGEPLVTLLKFLFMDRIENNLFPKIWTRNIHDKIDKVDKMLEVLNKMHRNLWFTMEVENDRELSFLDLRILRRDNEVLTFIENSRTHNERFWEFRTTFLPKMAHFHTIFLAFSLSHGPWSNNSGCGEGRVAESNWKQTIIKLRWLVIAIFNTNQKVEMAQSTERRLRAYWKTVEDIFSCLNLLWTLSK